MANKFSVKTLVIGNNNLTNTGASLYLNDVNILQGISGELQNTGTNLNNKIIGLSGELQETGTNLNNLINGLSGQLNISGDLLYLKSNPAQFVNSGNLYSTGSNLYSLINTERNKNTITGISISGGNSITGLLSFTGIGGLNVIQLNNTIQFSGGGGGTTTNVTGNNILIPNEMWSGKIGGLGLSSVPKSVSLTVESPSTGLLFFAGIKDIPTTDGFYYQLNSVTDGTGYKLHYTICL